MSDKWTIEEWKAKLGSVRDHLVSVEEINRDLVEALKACQVRIMMLEGNQGDTYQQAARVIARAEGKGGMKMKAQHTAGPLPEGWTLKDGTIHYHEDDYHKYILDKSGRIDRNAVALTLENYGYQDHARRWFLSPAEMAAPELLEACKMALDYIADYCPAIGGTLTMTLNAAINKAAGKEG